MPSKQQQIVEEIIKSLESGVENSRGWEAPWHGAVTPPRNIVSNVNFTGGNAMWLWFASQMYNYSSNDWATMKQWNSVGAKLKKGSKAGLQFAIRPIIKTDDETGDKYAGGFATYPVWNKDQIENVPPEYIDDPEVELEFQANQDIDDFIESCEIETKHSDSRRAFYRIKDDYVHMPNKSWFKSTNGYYSTIFHEYVHATGAYHRLDRAGITDKFRNEEVYAKEELIAELGASFLCAKFGIHSERQDDTVKYLKSWIKILKEKPSILWNACADAQKAVDYLVERSWVKKELGPNEHELYEKGTKIYSSNLLYEDYQHHTSNIFYRRA